MGKFVMNKALKTLSMWAYLLGALVSAVSLLAMPFTYGTSLWETNLQIAMVVLGLILATALFSAAGLLSKNFPVHFLLVIGTGLLVSTLALTSGQNAVLTLVQQASLGLLILFVGSRLIIEFVLEKPNAH
jgi:hypothetical protein